MSKVKQLAVSILKELGYVIAASIIKWAATDLLTRIEKKLKNEKREKNI